MRRNLRLRGKMAPGNVIRKHDAKNFDELRQEQERKLESHRGEDGRKLDAAADLLFGIHNSSFGLLGGVKSIFRRNSGWLGFSDGVSKSLF